MRTLAVLTRAPIPGAGKSRLRADIDGRTVDRLAVAFLRDTFTWSQQLGVQLLVACQGPFAALPDLDGAIVVGQADGDLGVRIEAAIETAFRHGADRVVQVGSDSPTLPPALLQRCFDELEQHAAVVIPAEDGGWVALGVRRPLSGCLLGVGWSTSATGDETVAALRRGGRETAVLEPWYDVDSRPALSRLQGELVRCPAFAPHTAAVLRSLE